jgi:hypothetical protein
MIQERTPFDSTEGALEYVALLREAIEKARKDVAADIGRASAARVGRRLEALQLIAYKIERLGCHMGTSHRILNDLRILRRLLLDERRKPARRIRIAASR